MCMFAHTHTHTNTHTHTQNPKQVERTTTKVKAMYSKNLMQNPRGVPQYSIGSHPTAGAVQRQNNHVITSKTTEMLNWCALLPLIIPHNAIHLSNSPVCPKQKALFEEVLVLW